jgi:hypothetical protein
MHVSINRHTVHSRTRMSVGSRYRIRRGAGMRMGFNKCNILIGIEMLVAFGCGNAHAIAAVIMSARWAGSLPIAAKVNMSVRGKDTLTHAGMGVVYHWNNFGGCWRIIRILGESMRMRGSVGNRPVALMRMDGNGELASDAIKRMRMRLNGVQRAQVAMRMAALVRRDLASVCQEVGIK